VKNLTVLSDREPEDVIRDALEVAADALGAEICWFYRGGFHFKLAGEWTVSIAPETAGRLRVETWWMLLPRDRKWVNTGDHDRLAHLVRDAQSAALQPA
jgi:hypothetical protein